MLSKRLSLRDLKKDAISCFIENAQTAYRTISKIVLFVIGRQRYRINDNIILIFYGTDL